MIRFYVGGLRPPSDNCAIDFELFSSSIKRSRDAGVKTLVPAAQPRTEINLRSGLTSWPIRDQGVSAMCVPYAVAACIELRRALATGETAPTRMSAGYLYWACRQQKHDDDEEGVDRGRVSFGDAVRALREVGICPIDACPDALRVGEPAQIEAKDKLCFPDLMGAVRRFPGKSPEGDAAKATMANIIDVILCDLHDRRPVGLGFPIYPSNGLSTNWNDAGEGDGTVRFPIKPDPKCHIGGHAVCVTGFQPSDQPNTGGGYFVFRNSVGGDFATRNRLPGVTGYGYGRVSLRDAKDHAWGLFRLRCHSTAASDPSATS